jgi:hypothetical protein
VDLPVIAAYQVGPVALAGIGLCVAGFFAGWALQHGRQGRRRESLSEGLVALVLGGPVALYLVLAIG